MFGNIFITQFFGMCQQTGLRRETLSRENCFLKANTGWALEVLEDYKPVKYMTVFLRAI